MSISSTLVFVLPTLISAAVLNMGTLLSPATAGTTWGVAKRANLFGVKVLSDFGSSSTTGVVAWVDWAN